MKEKNNALNFFKGNFFLCHKDDAWLTTIQRIWFLILRSRFFKLLISKSRMGGLSEKAKAPPNQGEFVF